MSHINLENQLPGVTGLLEYRKDTGNALRELTQILLRGPSTLSEAERELLATIVSHNNKCTYCVTSHAAAADVYQPGARLAEAVRNDIETAPVSEKMKALLQIASSVQDNGKNVKDDHIIRAKNAGATDLEIHDTVLIAALFSLYNRYVDGLGTFAPSDPSYYSEMAKRLRDKGYFRPESGYSNLSEINTLK